MILANAIELKTGPVWKGLSDEELLDLCSGNKELKIERDEKGNIFIMSATKFGISRSNANLAGELYIWSKKYKKGVLTESNGGYILPDTSMRAPDIAFLLNDKYASLSKEEQSRIPAVCPDFVVEIISSKEELKAAKKKMAMWMRNGCKIAWLVDIFAQKVYVFEQDSSEYIHDDFNKEFTGTQFLSDFTFLPAEVFVE